MSPNIHDNDDVLLFSGGYKLKFMAFYSVLFSCSAIPVFSVEAITYLTARELRGSGIVSMTVLVR